MKPHFALLLLFLGLCVYRPALAVSTDVLAEVQISQELADLPNTELLQLQVDGQDFPALFSPAAAAQVSGVVILLHDMGQHLNWPGVIQPLREELPRYGWATLSLQMPVLPMNVEQSDYGKSLQLASQRIQAGYDYLRGKKLLNTVLIGQGLGAASAIRHISQQEETPFVALVLISMADWNWLTPPLDALQDLGKISIPVLDVYASNDRAAVLEAVAERKKLIRPQLQETYRAARIGGAGPYYSGFEQALLKRVRSWLFVVAPASEVPIVESK